MRYCRSCNNAFTGEVSDCPRCSGTLEVLSHAFFLNRKLGNKYILDRVLGAGGMGVVYQAHHVTLGRPFAVKILTGIHSEQDSGWKRFRREAETAAQIQHPHVISVVDYDVSDEGIPYLVMEFIEGVTLYDFIQQRHPLSYTVFLRILKQIALGLQAAHKKHIVHRDLKPQNIILQMHDEQPFVKILDFGLARLQQKEERPESALTGTGVIMGTPHYLSPVFLWQENMKFLIGQHEEIVIYAFFKKKYTDTFILTFM